MRFGQLLFLVLFLLIALAISGILDWDTVGNWGIFMVILALAGPVIGLFTYIIYQIKEKAGDESVVRRKRQIGKIINWLIILSGIIIVIFIFVSGYLEKF